MRTVVVSCVSLETIYNLFPCISLNNTLTASSKLMTTMQAMESMLGSTVVNKDGKSIDVNSFSGPGKVVGLYFSAHWCPPCRAFTPELANFYTKFKASEKGSSLEIVFVSSDKNEEEFKEYLSEMPFPALAFDQRDKKANLSKKFKVSGIPTLIFLDADTGKMITAEGRGKVTDDPEGKEFPWIPKPFNEVIKGNLIRNDKQEVDAGEALKGKIVAVYFSAHWCPPCKAFTPNLAKFYNKMKEQGKQFEIIFASSDRSQESFDEYFGTMPWLALPWNDPRKNQLTQTYSVEGIPCLVFLNENGETITKNGRGAVMGDKDGKDFPYHPKPLNELTGMSADVLNESACLIIFTDTEDQKNEAVASMQSQADIYHAKGDDKDLHFFYGAEDEICDSVKEFAGIEDKFPLMVILDIGTQKIYTHDGTISKENVDAFVGKWADRSLPSKPLRM
ncbi:unnamed protein product [Owenia fusiformis]|uniref:Nucleoredoxin n=1 Tax=Owenia fusiformis TaxID=6347 RepID=A0A8S4Q5M4_OWEFU|nr:unnamed protein product [Owenia fusiformis]